MSLQYPTDTALKHFKLRAMAETNYQITFDEDQDMESQPIHPSRGESEIASFCLSPGPQLLNNVSATYNAITQLIAAQHEQMSFSGNLALQYSPNPPISLISIDDDDGVFTPKFGNPTQHVPYTPKRCPHFLQVRQQLIPIRDTPNSPTPENRGQPDLFRP